MKRKNLLILLSLAIVGSSMYMVQDVHAQSAKKTLIERIAEKFNLKKEDVQNTVDDFRSENVKTMQEQKKKRMEEKLTQAVKDGTITENQKQAILKKMEEQQKKHEIERAEMKAWAQKNGLDNLGMKLGFGMHKFGRGMHNWK